MDAYQFTKAELSILGNSELTREQKAKMLGGEHLVKLYLGEIEEKLEKKLAPVVPDNPAVTEEPAGEKGMKKMSDNIKAQFIQKVDCVVYDLQFGRLAISDDDGNAYSLVASDRPRTKKDVAENVPLYEIAQNPLQAITMSVPAYATRCTLANLKDGDILVDGEKTPKFVTGVSGGRVQTMSIRGTISSTKPPVSTLFGAQGVMVVRNPLNLTGGLDVANSLLPFLAMNDDKDDLGMLLFALSSAGQGGTLATQGNLLPLMLLFKKSEGGIDPAMLMALSGGCGQQQNAFLQAMLMQRLTSKKE